LLFLLCTVFLWHVSCAAVHLVFEQEYISSQKENTKLTSFNILVNIMYICIAGHLINKISVITLCYTNRLIHLEAHTCVGLCSNLNIKRQHVYPINTVRHVFCNSSQQLHVVNYVSDNLENLFSYSWIISEATSELFYPS